MKEIKVPTIHLNGTSREVLVDQLSDIIRAIDAALMEIRMAWPLGRDYYPQSDVLDHQRFLGKVREQWRERLEKLIEVKQDFEQIREKIL